MRVLVTGGAGFLGAWVARRLVRSGLEVRSLDVADDRGTARFIMGVAADAVEWRRGDVSRGEDVLEASRGCAGIVHIAGVLTPACRADPVRGAMVNVLGTLNVFEAAKGHGIGRVLYTSSAAVFGPDDTDQPRPVTHYGAFKLATEGSARAYWADEGISSMGLRPLVIYGPGRELGPSAGISLACRAAAEGRSYQIPFSGRSGFVFADEVAAAFEAALSGAWQGARIYNFWGNVADTEMLAQAIGRHARGAVITAGGPPLPVPADIASQQIYDDFPEIERTALDLGILRTIEHYRSAAEAV
jgi:UDP-glucose 4-epimerase